MVDIEKLNHINDNIENFYWGDSELENQSVTFGGVHIGHIILKYNNEEAFISFTFFEENQSTAYNPHRFSLLLFSEHYKIIKNISLKVNTLFLKSNFIENQRNNALNLMANSSNFIAENFNKK